MRLDATISLRFGITFVSANSTCKSFDFFQLLNIPAIDLFLLTIPLPNLDRPTLVPRYAPYEVPEPLF